MEQKQYIKQKEIIRIVEAYSDLLLRIAVNRVRSISEGEDIVQSVFVKLLTAQPKFADFEHERKWLIRTTVNLCKDYRKSATRRECEVLDENLAGEMPAESTEVLDALYQLPENDRYAIFLYYYERMTIREIADVTSEHEGTIASRLSRGRKKLRSILKGGQI